jgi:hypothetical protein
MLRGEVEYWKTVVKISEKVGDGLGLGGILRGTICLTCLYISHYMLRITFPQFL